MTFFAAVLGIVAVGLYVWGDKHRIRLRETQALHAETMVVLEDASRLLDHLHRQVGNHLRESVEMGVEIDRLQTQNAYLLSCLHHYRAGSVGMVIHKTHHQRSKLVITNEVAP